MRKKNLRKIRPELCRLPRETLDGMLLGYLRRREELRNLANDPEGPHTIADSLRVRLNDVERRIRERRLDGRPRSVDFLREIWARSRLKTPERDLENERLESERVEICSELKAAERTIFLRRREADRVEVEIGDIEHVLYVLRRRRVRSEEAEDQAESRRREIAALRAATATTAAEARELAAAVRRRLPEQDCCPYCGGALGAQPHADHIYPISKGGRSTEQNMVFVCASCNLMKSDLTLSSFIKFYCLDREAIENRLWDMNKEF